MKITATRLLELGKIMTTEVGQMIPEFFEYMAEFVEQNVRALRNGLTFEDNVNCEVRTVELRHDVEETIAVPNTVRGVIVSRVFSSTVLLREYGWYYNDRQEFRFRAVFDSDPGRPVSIAIILLF